MEEGLKYIANAIGFAALVLAMAWSIRGCSDMARDVRIAEEQTKQIQATSQCCERIPVTLENE